MNRPTPVRWATAARHSGTLTGWLDRFAAASTRRSTSHIERSRPRPLAANCPTSASSSGDGSGTYWRTIASTSSLIGHSGICTTSAKRPSNCSRYPLIAPFAISWWLVYVRLSTSPQPFASCSRRTNSSAVTSCPRPLGSIRPISSRMITLRLLTEAVSRSYSSWPFLLIFGVNPRLSASASANRRSPHGTGTSRYTARPWLFACCHCRSVAVFPLPVGPTIATIRPSAIARSHARQMASVTSVTANRSTCWRLTRSRSSATRARNFGVACSWLPRHIRRIVSGSAPTWVASSRISPSVQP